MFRAGNGPVSFSSARRVGSFVFREFILVRRFLAATSAVCRLAQSALTGNAQCRDDRNTCSTEQQFVTRLLTTGSFLDGSHPFIVYCGHLCDSPLGPSLTPECPPGGKRRHQLDALPAD